MNRVLIVDDSPVVQLSLTKALGVAGVTSDRVTAVGTGEEAVSSFPAVDPDLVFLDMLMPGMDGEQAANLLLSQNPTARLVVITGLQREDDRVRRLISLGAFEVLQKPVRLDDVKRVLWLFEQEEGRLRRIQ